MTIRATTIARHVGRRYGRLTVLAFSHQQGKANYFYKTVCDCGKEHLARMSCLQQGTTSSCGCFGRERSSEANKGNTRKRLGYGESARNTLIHKYRRNAALRGISFALAPDEFYALLSGDCYYCGAAPSNVERPPTGYGEFVYSGIDRVDNELGYEAGNTVPCCKACNSAKGAVSKRIIEMAHAFILRRERERVLPSCDSIAHAQPSYQG